MRKPSNKDIQRFLEIFDKLAQFEAEQRVIRGIGCFNAEDLPFKEVKKVTKWLKFKATTDEKDVVDSLIIKYEKKADDLRVESVTAKASNDYVMYETLNEEAQLYETLIEDLKGFGSIGKIKLK